MRIELGLKIGKEKRKLIGESEITLFSWGKFFNFFFLLSRANLSNILRYLKNTPENSLGCKI